MFPSQIPKEDIKHLPLMKFDGKIHLINTDDELKEAFHVMAKSDFLGFDTETKPTFNKGEYNQTALNNPVRLNKTKQLILNNP